MGKLDDLFKKLKPQPSIFNTKKVIDDYGQAKSGERVKRSVNLNDVEQNLEQEPVSAPAPATAPVADHPEKIKTAASPEPKVPLPNQGGKTLETNLIQGEIVSYFDWREAGYIIGKFALIGLVIVGLLYGALFYWQTYKQEQGQIIIEGYNELESQVALLEKDIKNVVTVQAKVKAAKTLLDNHIYWTNFFDFLETDTLSDVYFDNFKGDTGGDYTLAAHAPDYEALSQQVSLLRANTDQVKTVEVMGGQSTDINEGSGSRIDFTLGLTVDPEIFKK